MYYIENWQSNAWSQIMNTRKSIIHVRNKVKDDEKNSQKLNGSYFSINLIVKIVLFNFSVLT